MEGFSFDDNYIKVKEWCNCNGCVFIFPCTHLFRTSSFQKFKSSTLQSIHNVKHMEVISMIGTLVVISGRIFHVTDHTTPWVFINIARKLLTKIYFSFLLA